MAKEEDRNKFVTLAKARVNKALKAIELIGNLSNRSNYFYTDDDVAKIFKALNEELSVCRKKFDAPKKNPDAVKFSLD